MTCEVLGLTGGCFGEVLEIGFVSGETDGVNKLCCLSGGVGVIGSLTLKSVPYQVYLAPFLAAPVEEQEIFQPQLLIQRYTCFYRWI